MVNYYHVLGVPEFAPEQDIQDAYMSLTQPPDGVSDGRTRDKDLIGKAYKCLIYKASKTRYDKKIMKSERGYQERDDERAIRYANRRAEEQANVRARVCRAGAVEKEEDLATREETKRMMLGERREVCNGIGPGRNGVKIGRRDLVAESSEESESEVGDPEITSLEELDALFEGF
ncbi:MAG: hypothetical protein Q9199_004991 [Rusavskia elegans]